MKSYGNDRNFTPKSRFVLCFTYENGLVFWIVSFIKTVQIVPFVYQRKIWVDCPFHLCMGIDNVCVVGIAEKIALFHNIK